MTGSQMVFALGACGGLATIGMPGVRNCFQAGTARAGRGVNPGVVPDLPDRRGSDGMAEPDEFAWHAPVSPRRALGGDADHQLADRGCRRQPPATPTAGVVPLACGR